MLVTKDTTERFDVFAGGWEYCAKGYKIERNNFPYYSLEFVVAGQGRVIVNNEESELIPGVFFSYGPDIPHMIIMDAKHPLEKYFVNIQCGTAEDFFGSVTASLYGRVFHSSRPHSIQQTFDELINYGVERSEWSTRICNHLVQLLVLKMSESSIKSEDFSGIAYANYLRCVSMINRRYLEFKGLEDIAEACCIDISYLCRLFKNFSHQSPYQYFLRLNMNHAADLLLQNNRQIQEVADMMDYEDPLHFSRTFKKVMGICPSEFIKLSKGNPEATGAQ
jgi:AraC-like DNA-binding protein